jgi:glutathione S-transferase
VASGRIACHSAGVVRLYRAHFSTNVERVSLALAHKGVEVESVVIDYADRSPVLEVSGQPLVPVIVDDGQVVADSVAILRHLERTRPEPSLFPRNGARQAELDVFLEWFNVVWKEAPNAVESELEKPDPDEARVAGHAQRMRSSLDLFESMLDGRDHLLGDFSAADCAAFPFLKYARLGPDPEDDELFHRILADHLRTGDDRHPRLWAWIERMEERPRV